MLSIVAYCRVEHDNSGMGAAWHLKQVSERCYGYCYHIATVIVNSVMYVRCAYVDSCSEHG